MVVLAADVGGTKTRVALFSGVRCLREEKYPSKNYASLAALLQQFVSSSSDPIEAAALGVAGPVKKGRCQATNLPWVIDAKEIERALSIPKVDLLNDLEANAYGIRRLSPKDLFTLNQGDPGSLGNAALISAGTGLGEAGLFWNGKVHLPFACEGGHVDFAPRDELEMALWQYLHKEYGHVSYERVVSGPGLYHLYRFLVDTKRAKEEDPLTGDFSQCISQRALEKSSAICTRVLDWFVSLYGSAGGNLALKFLALGGVYIGGGIAPNILAALEKGNFMGAFVEKGRFASLLKDIPVQVILNDKTALLGAAYYAQEITRAR